MSHSIIPPSSAHIWGKPNGCTGWVKMVQAYSQEDDSEAAREGVAAHEMAAQIIIHNEVVNDIVFTEEMFESAKIYTEDVLTEMRLRSDPYKASMGVETKINAYNIHELSFGTCDAFVYDPNTNELIIWDYKFGMGLVEAFENWQLINYASGLIDMLNISEHLVCVKMRIVQPRAFHPEGTIREWVVQASELEKYFSILRKNAKEALSPNAKYRTGEHCRYCPGRHACPAALQAGLTLYEMVTKPIPQEMPNESMGIQLSMIKRAKKALEYIESGLEEQVKSIIKLGGSVSGWKSKPAYGREKWHCSLEEVFAMGDKEGFDLREPKAITPNKARKLGIDESVIMEYSSRQGSGIRIVQDNDNKLEVF